MATIIQTTDSNVSTSPVFTLGLADYFYQVAGVSLTTTDGLSPAISAGGSNTIEIHGSVFSPNVAIGGFPASVIVAAGGSVSGGQTGLQTLNTTADMHDAIDGSLSGGTYGLNSSGTGILYLNVGSQGSVTGLGSDGIHLAQLVYGTINGTVSGVNGISEASTDGLFNLAVSQGAKVTGTSAHGIAFANMGSLAIDGQVAGFHSISSTTSSAVTITVGTTGSVAGSGGDGIDLMSQSGALVVNGSVTGGSDGIFGGTSLGTTDITVGAAGFVSGGDMGIEADNNAIITVAGAVSGGADAPLMSSSWGILTGTFSEAGEVYVAAGGLVTGSGGKSGGALRMRGTHVIENDGTIASAAGVGVQAEGAGYLLNTGRITTGTVGILYADTFDTSDVVTTVNIGTIAGAPDPQIATGPNFLAYDASGSIATDRFINQGTVIGDVRLGQHSGSNLVNAGTLTGSVYLGPGGQVANSTLGTVSGLVVGGAGDNTIVGGQSGGTLLGGAGNDMLYANPTMAAADNHAMATLDGGTGTNALYGGSGWNMFVGGDSGGGYNQIWGGASGMTGVAGFTNNTITFAALDPTKSVYVDLLSGHDAYINSGQNQSGVYTYEDSIINVPNVVGSSSGDIIIADNGTDRIQGNGGADALYAGTGQDTFVYTDFTQSNINLGYDTIAGFKIGTDKIDISALHTDPGHLQLSNAGLANTVYVLAGSSFNPATDLAISVNATTAGGLTVNNFVF